VGPLIDIHLMHRLLMYVASALIVALVVLAVRRAPSSNLARASLLAAGLLVLQVVLGALNVWLEEYELLILAHLTVATLLWGQLLAVNLDLYPVRAGATAPAGRSEAAGAGRPRAVTA
jgi:heme A synthase